MSVSTVIILKVMRGAIISGAVIGFDGGGSELLDAFASGFGNFLFRLRNGESSFGGWISLFLFDPSMVFLAIVGFISIFNREVSG
jgi:hypothetical protein